MLRRVLINVVEPGAWVRLWAPQLARDWVDAERRYAELADWFGVMPLATQDPWDRTDLEAFETLRVTLELRGAPVPPDAQLREAAEFVNASAAALWEGTFCDRDYWTGGPS
jgi:hypothetical protein